MKRLIYRFACWLEQRALDLQDWSEPATIKLDLSDIVIGGINRTPSEFWENARANNAPLDRLAREENRQ